MELREGRGSPEDRGRSENLDTRTHALELQVAIDRTIINSLRSLEAQTCAADVVSLFLKEIGIFYEARACFWVRRDSREPGRLQRFVWYRPGAAPLLWEEEDDAYLAALLERCPAERIRYAVDDPDFPEEQYPGALKLMRRHGVGKVRGVPLFSSGPLVGFIGCLDPEQHTEVWAVLETLSYFIPEEYSRHELSERLSYLSYHDTLTGLLNRNSFTEYQEGESGRVLAAIGVATADLNALKEINRLRGTKEGDRILRSTAALLKTSFPGAKIYRLNGDEFLVIAENAGQDFFSGCVQRVYDGSASLEAYGISIGFAWSGQEPDFTQLMAQANELMLIQKQTYYYNSKKEYNIGKHGHDQIKHLLEDLENGSYVMYLQPKVDCKTEALCGAEALVRYDSPKYGRKNPAQFIHELEQNYIIKYLDLFIFEELCKTMARWQREGRALFPVSLNFSRLTLLEPGILQTVQSIAEKYGVPKGLIEVEITESVGVYEDKTIAEIGEGIKRAGFRLALDDFGSHYTNMSILAIVPADVLKIDRSMIRDILRNNAYQIMLKYLFLCCRDLGIRSIAEGIESRDQLELLRSIHCDEIQGYLFGRPIPVSEFEARFWGTGG